MQQARVIVDFPGRDRNLERYAFDPPTSILAAHRLDDVRAALREAELAAAAGHWVAGFIAYEAAPAFDAALVTRPHEGPAPLAWFGVFDAPAAVRPPARASGQTTALAWIPGPLAWIPNVTRAEYDAAIAHIRDRIAAGDVYQVNHTLRFIARFGIEPSDLYDALVAARHGRYHALIETPEWAIVSASPELFIDVRDRVITTRPMKGTARRGRWSEEDDLAAQRLARSAKDRAENLMIVDLLRNDIGRIAQFGSVQVHGMHAIETYPTVHQMTSTITAHLRDGVTIDDIFAAMFPCGSVTGAPKVAAMQHIAALESAPRGPYCGAVGVLRPDGTATFNVGIRTVLVDRAKSAAVYGAGGGITWDSTSDAEYDEAVAKAALLSQPELPSFDLLETMRLENGEVRRLELHLERLTASARYWGFDEDAPRRAAAALQKLASESPTGLWRVRMTVSHDAHVSIGRVPLEAAELSGAGTARDPRHGAVGSDPRHGAVGRDARHGAVGRDAHDGAVGSDARDGAVGRDALHHVAGSADGADSRRPVILANEPVDSRDPLLYHKTTARTIYEARKAAHPNAFDVLLHNERGCITEFTIGNVICEIDGELVTPPRDAGLLAGTFRQQLLEAGLVRESDIAVADLPCVTRMWLVNTVREWVPVRFTAPGDR
ncbi:MAG TPA: aminodeoxychorismate synthase component I [Longimicrobiales bacterium]|nr:aminodeoxychorismate synthase component I [Longimicrobiales bacterium]